MNNFTFANPVKIIFGKGTIPQISTEIPKDAKILMIYGGGSIKQNGVYDQVCQALKGREVHEFSGIEPNPHYETCLKAVDLIKEKNIDFLLAVGGGSVLDATKFIALAACFDGEPWDIIAKGAKPTTALPVGTILTLFATGSEMNCGGVITRQATQQKQAYNNPLAYPRFSVLDPTTTYSLPLKQVGNGIVDTFVHVLEQYLTIPTNAAVQDGMAEAVLKVLCTEGPKGMTLKDDYDSRANLMWASTWGLNGWIGCGVPNDWATHMIGHEITAFYGLDHAQTLAIVMPGVMKFLKEQKGDKIVQLGQNVFGVSHNLDRETQINQTIQKVEDFFQSVGVGTRLSDYNLGAEVAEKVSARIAERGWVLGENRNITADMVESILRSRI